MKKLIQKGELNISRQEIAPLERTSEGQLRGGFSGLSRISPKGKFNIACTNQRCDTSTGFNGICKNLGCYDYTKGMDPSKPTGDGGYGSTTTAFVPVPTSW